MRIDPWRGAAAVATRTEYEMRRLGADRDLLRLGRDDRGDRQHRTEIVGGVRLERVGTRGREYVRLADVHGITEGIEQAERLLASLVVIERVVIHDVLDQVTVRIGVEDGARAFARRLRREHRDVRRIAFVEQRLNGLDQRRQVRRPRDVDNVRKDIDAVDRRRRLIVDGRRYRAEVRWWKVSRIGGLERRLV